ncbi:hypothetical protein BGY98DRAFT_967080 [Russula aff. rugulosa BPL654]|nr:hypothetical protein BGY98DRAFT_967080 [Russula aff. rugulosa BPL654]
MALYRDVGHGLRKAQQTVNFALVADYLLHSDHWDMMFMEHLMSGITMHKPLVPPRVVLTLGNGSDFWALRAAQEWPQCRITAHSLFGVYKDGMSNLIRSRGFADRVTYVRGDPSKELRLDYLNDTFDMVRLSYCSLHLAETEWYMFLQEVNRVLKPGGVLEVIDEDLLFPGHKPKLNGSAPPAQRRRRESSVVSSLSPTLNSRFMRTPDTSSVDVKTPPWHMNGSEDLRSSLQDAIETVNHSRLARAWHEMLTSRWISASITSVLPFYLSAIFHSFRALPALEILTGPSSLSTFPSQQIEQLLDPEPFRHLRHATVKDYTESSVTWLPKNEAPPHFIPSHASVHLARMVAIVTSCKEAIWGSYNKLFCEDLRSRRPNDASGRTNKFTMREEFENCWFNWACDMRSQIDMAGKVKEPGTDSDLDRCVKCAKNVQRERDLIGIASPQIEKPEVIRCVRGFVAWKSSGSAPVANAGAGLPGMGRRSVFSSMTH